MSTKGRIVLIGAGGFVGPHLVRRLLSEGWTVVGITRRIPDRTFSDKNYIQLTIDATKVSSYREHLLASDGIVFNAAYIPADYSSSREAQECLFFNSLLPVCILEAVGGSRRHFIYISGGQGYQVEKRLATETDPFFPSGRATYYLASKLLGDIFTEHFRNCYSAETTVLRAGSLYGPGQKRGMIPKFINAALAEQPIVLEDGGKHSVDLTFVGDLAASVVGALSLRKMGIFNIGSGRETSALEAARLILSAAGSSEQFLTINPEVLPNIGSGFAGLDVTRARQELKLMPTLPYDGLSLTVKTWIASS